MNISESASFDKTAPSLWRKVFLALVILLVALLSFGVGRLTGTGKGEPIKIEYDPSLSSVYESSSQTASVINAVAAGKSSSDVSASSNGKKYYYPNCSGLKRISEANLITFSSPEAAEASGYTLAANCKP